MRGRDDDEQRAPRSAGRRAGFSLMELLVVVVILGILAGVGMPLYQKVTYRARAASLINDLQVVRTAAHQYQAAENAWPPDAERGDVPPAFAPYVEMVQFAGDGYTLDWDNWDPIIGISVVVDDPGLESALLATLAESEGTFMRMDDRYTYFIEASVAP